MNTFEFIFREYEPKTMICVKSRIIKVKEYDYLTAIDKANLVCKDANKFYKGECLVKVQMLLDI